MGRREDTELDRELAVLPPEMRWREWMRRIEAVLFASATPVAREDLARVVGQGASVDLLIEDLAVDLEGRPYEVAQVGKAWMLRTRAACMATARFLIPGAKTPVSWPSVAMTQGSLWVVMLARRSPSLRCMPRA